MRRDADGHCQNCGSPLYGEHCYACGQPTKGLVRHFASVAADVADTLFNLDGRLLRTLPALLFKPGFLTREYLDGHRVRYASPVRLVIVLCIATFFAAKLATPSFQMDGEDRLTMRDAGTALFEPGKDEGFEALDRVDAVDARLAEVLAEIDTARAEARGVPGLPTVFDRTEAELRAAAAARRAAIEAGAATPAVAESRSEPAFELDVRSDTPNINFNGRPWHPETNPLVVDALPEAGNAWLNAQIAHVPENWKRVRQDPDLLRNAFYSALPTALFVLVPVFALLLKVLYVYRDELYMAHLVSALHGHAFVCAMLLVLMGLSSLESLLGSPAWLAAPMGWLEWLAMLWIPVYLWLHLKRVQGQGGVATTANYLVLATAEMVLLSMVTTVALMSAIVWL